MGYLKNAFKLTKSQRRIMVAFFVIFSMTSNRVQAAEADAFSPYILADNSMQDEVQDTKSIGFHVLKSVDFRLPSLSDVPAQRTYHVSMTAYNSEEGQTDSTPFIAADGTHVYDGMIAANFLKFKTRVRIPALYGNKVFIVHDRMNKRYTDKVDVWMENHEDAMQFGHKHNVVIEVL